MTEQAEVMAFLSDRRAYSPVPDRVAQHGTHCAVVFLAGNDAYKIKRAVRLPYLDFSTLAQRRRVCQREVELNRRTAPDLYLGVVPITREADGRLSIDGAGIPVEWAVRMRRFDDDALLSDIAERGKLDRGLAESIADAIAAFHAEAPRLTNANGPARLRRDLDELTAGFAKAPNLFAPDRAAKFTSDAQHKLSCISSLLQRRGEDGFVRHCHGDLHLRNIALWRGLPLLFDAIEFSDEIATIDTLYDLAFLIMDLDRCNHRSAANVVLGRYLWRTQDDRDLEALAALPLFLSLRAGIRAMVTSDRIAQESEAAAQASREHARHYFDAALTYLAPTQARLVALGGLSGSGKSTLGHHIAPLFAPTPGALHLRSDLERKALLCKDETDRLGPDAYTEQMTARVYGVLRAKAQVALQAGHSVIVDAVHARPEERAAVEKIAADLHVPFTGIWLRAPQEELVRRVSTRSGDASDATPEVVRHQHSLDLGPLGWMEIDTGATAQAAISTARAALGV